LLADYGCPKDIDQIALYVTDPLWPSICPKDLDEKCDLSIINSKALKDEYSCKIDKGDVQAKVITYTIDCSDKKKRGELITKLIDNGFKCISR
jgi:hypothetical protein